MFLVSSLGNDRLGPVDAAGKGSFSIVVGDFISSVKA